jgi:hypothetical protein
MKLSTLITIAAAVSAALASQLAMPTEAANVNAGETCAWRGTAPFCDGSCEQGERVAMERGSWSTSAIVSVAEGGKVENDFGEACATGSKMLCCRSEAPAPPAPVDANWATFCDGYATRAVASVAESQEKKCAGLEGPRWDPSREAHLNWCLTQGGGPQPSAEELHRIRLLKECMPQKAVGKVKPEKAVGKVKWFVCAIGDLDVYDSPVEPRNVIAMMTDGTKGRVVDQHEDGWLKLQGVAGGGDGWVASGNVTQC